MATQHSNNKSKALALLAFTATQEEIAHAERFAADSKKSRRARKEVHLALNTIIDYSGCDLEFKFLQRLRWANLTVKYHAGNRDKEVVCAHLARTASLLVIHGSKSRPGKACYENHVLTPEELFSVGYAAALAAWDKYDPAKDTGNGLDGLLFTKAEGAARNAAAEMTHRMGLRVHEKGEVLPTVFPHTEYKDDGLGSNGATKPANTKFNYENADASGTGKAVEPLVFCGGVEDTTCKAPKPVGIAAPPSDKWVDKQAQDAAKVCLFELIEQLPSTEEQELFKSIWGVLDRRKETIVEIALRLGVEYQSMRRKIDALNQEVLAIARKRNPKSMATVPLNYTLTVQDYDAPESVSAADKPVFRNGARITPRSSKKVIHWDSHPAQQKWDLSA